MADNDFRTLLNRVHAGDEGAAQQLVDRYGHDLLRVVRKHLPARLRPRFDSSDFTQDAWTTFFTAITAGSSFGSADDLTAFLTCVGRNKVIDAVRRHLYSRKHNVTREQSLDLAHGTGRMAANQATPSTIAMSREEWERLLQMQPPLYRRILILVRQGKTATEAAAEVGVSERTARRLVAKFLPGLTQ